MGKIDRSAGRGTPIVRWIVLFAVGLVVIGWLLNTPAGIFGKADAIGYAVCHRIEARSFHLGERQMPLCVRCSGMYLGAMLGLAFQFITGRRHGGNPPKAVLIALGVLFAAFAVDGLNSYLSLPFFPGAPTLYEPSSASRLLSGTGMGLVIALVLFPAFNQTVWRDWKVKPAIAGMPSFLLLCALALLLDLLVLTENPLVLYPLALISAAGVLVLLSTVYGMIWIILFRQENLFVRYSQLWLPLLAGFGVAMLQIIGFSVIRYALTGTWEGFHLG